MTQQKFTDLRYKTSQHPPYSPDLLPTDSHFFFFCSKGVEEIAFKYFLVSKPLEFYCTGKNNLVNQWQKCMFRDLILTDLNTINLLIQG